MKCCIIKDLFPLYTDHLISEDTRKEIDVHLQSCDDCTKYYQNKTEHPFKESGVTHEDLIDADKLKKVRQKISKKTHKILFIVGAIFIALLLVIILYTSIRHPVTRDDISLSTKTEDGYTYIILEIKAGKTLIFDSKTEDILGENQNVYGQKTTLYHVYCKNNFSSEKSSIIWGSHVYSGGQFLHFTVELDNEIRQINSED